MTDVGRLGTRAPPVMGLLEANASARSHWTYNRQSYMWELGFRCSAGAQQIRRSGRVVGHSEVILGTAYCACH
jgi:hypothetical protein